MFVFEALKLSTNLRYLSFEWNKITSEAMDTLQSALVLNSSLQYLNLAGNMIQSGASIINGLKVNESMENLQMKGSFDSR